MVFISDWRPYFNQNNKCRDRVYVKWKIITSLCDNLFTMTFAKLYNNWLRSIEDIIKENFVFVFLMVHLHNAKLLLRNPARNCEVISDVINELLLKLSKVVASGSRTQCASLPFHLLLRLTHYTYIIYYSQPPATSTATYRRKRT